MHKADQLSYRFSTPQPDRLEIHHNDLATNMVARLIERAVYLHSRSLDFHLVWPEYHNGVVPMLALNIVGWNHYDIGLFFIDFGAGRTRPPATLVDIQGHKLGDGDYRIEINLRQPRPLDRMLGAKGPFFDYLKRQIDGTADKLRRSRIKYEERILDRQDHRYEIQANSIPPRLPDDIEDGDYFEKVFLHLDFLDRINFSYLKDELKRKI